MGQTLSREQSIYQGLLEKQTAPVERAASVASEYSSDGLNALPSHDLKLDNTSLRIAVGLRLWLEIVAPHRFNGCNQLHLNIFIGIFFISIKAQIFSI